MQKIEVELTKVPKEKPKDQNLLGFGKIFTDHMFVMDYDTGIGWHDPRIIPYGNIEISPAAMCLHYGQEVFEGLKAYKSKDNRILLFRPLKNMQRMNISNDRLCIPRIDEEFCVEAIKKLVSVDKAWVPDLEGTALYIRPFMFAFEPKLGVHDADHYKFMVILSPVGSYYKEGLKPVKIYVEDELVRAVKGGTGFAKCGGNYAASILAQIEAEKKGYSQVLWLDGVHHKYVEEVGTMNAMFVIDGKIITAPLEGSVLPGVTRDSIITLLKSKGYTVEERHLSIDELIEASKAHKLTEAFGTGTAAVISPIGTLAYKDEVFFHSDSIGNISQMLYDTLTQIQNGIIEDKFNWTYEVK